MSIAPLVSFVVVSFSTNYQGRPCGRPPAAAVLGRQHHDGTAETASMLNHWPALDELSSLVVPANRQNVIARLQERLCLGPWIGDPTALAHRCAEAVSVTRRRVNSWLGSTMFTRLTASSFVRPATAHALTIRTGSCPRCRDSFGARRRGSGHRGRPSPSGSACDRCRHARAVVVLAGRALRVPVAPATGGLSRSTAVSRTPT